MLSALVFDFDGVIIDTESAIIHAWEAMHHDAGLACDRRLLQALIGHVETEIDVWSAFEPSIDRAGLEAEFVRRRRALMAAQPILPGVLRLLDEAASAGVPVAVASNSPHSHVDRHLHARGLRPRFTSVCCIDDVARGKPEPDVYLAALAALGAGASRAVAIEDSVPGHLAAKAAGLRCVVVPNPVTAHCEFEHADLRLVTLADTSLADLNQRFG